MRFNSFCKLFQFVILVIDSTDRERLSVTREELYKMLNHEELANAAVLIYANKQDVKDCMSAAEISRHLDLTSIKNQQWHIQSCCALTGEGYVPIRIKTDQNFKVCEKKPVYRFFSLSIYYMYRLVGALLLDLDFKPSLKNLSCSDQSL